MTTFQIKFISNYLVLVFRSKSSILSSLKIQQIDLPKMQTDVATGTRNSSKSLYRAISSMTSSLMFFPDVSPRILICTSSLSLFSLKAIEQIAKQKFFKGSIKAKADQNYNNDLILDAHDDL